MDLNRLPQYARKGHVSAAKIVDIQGEHSERPGLVLQVGDEQSMHIVSTAWMDRCQPVVGSWYVVHESGYANCWPADRFEECHQAVEADAGVSPESQPAE